MDKRRGLPAAETTRNEKYRRLNDEALISALKGNEAGAYLEFVRRYQGLAFKYARHFNVQCGQECEWVSDLLTDVLLLLMKPGAIMPESLGAYIARACRNKAYMEFRSRSRRQVREATAADDNDVPNPPDLEGAGLSPALKKFVAELEKILTAEERRLLDWSSESVPLRLIAEWCGITRTGASHRINRVRRRLRVVTPEIVSRFDQAERTEIGRFLLRAKGVSND